MGKILAQSKLRTLVILLVLAAGPGGETLSAFAIAAAINAIVARHLRLFLLDSLLAAVCFFGGSVGMYIGHVLYAKSTQEFLHQARAAYVTTASRDYVPFSDVNVTDGLNATTNDLNLINQTSFTGYIGVYLTALNAIFASIGLFVFHWSLAVLAIVLAVAMFLIPKLAKPALLKSTDAISVANARYTHDFKNWLTGLNDLFWANNINRTWQRICGTSKEIETSNVKQTRTNQLVSALVLSQNMLSQTLMLILAGILAFNGQVKLGVVISVGNLASQSFSALGAMANSMALVNSGRSLLTKAQNRVAAAQAAGNASPKPLVVPDDATIQCSGLTVRFTGQPRINYPDLRVAAGEKVAILGASGSGKTTLLKVLAGVVQPASGSVTIAGQDVTQLSPDQIATIVDMVPQAPTIFDASVRENVSLGQKLTTEDVQKILQAVNLEDRVQSLGAGIDTPINKDTQLSGGEQQRLALSRVLARHKHILLVDEGTSALDTANARSFVNLLLKLKDTTILFVTHSADQTMLNSFDRVVNLTPAAAS
ncbi:ATP-binding cassette domain-containing protein [Lacticaseibacillus zhaodongensis]|uniref:ATP-binding cassette domain-containing protein n=1 Tax=Lacticaseibacillus zhaodongensis TaxID=2668065 RepID=UPI0012D2ACED|nr:ABC transporter ATP-binding protein [Lacticaseibacillus zhaodongensis]